MDIHINALLQSCIENGILRIGQVAFTKDFRIFHREDFNRTDLEVSIGPDSARDIVRYDDAGLYRALKTAPNLRHGWELRVASVEELRLALDFLYPAALGLWLASLRSELMGISLRQTLGRQSGMYRVAARISDAQAEDLVNNFCRNGCLRTIKWKLNSSAIIKTDYERPAEIPLLCSEACCLFISEVRRIVKTVS